MTKPIILCVDDERIILEGLKEQLSRVFHKEYSVEIAENSQIALELLEELSQEGAEVPVVISDYIMPGMKGDELLKLIYQKNPQIRKVMLTGQADADAVGRAVNIANLYRYLSKPWEPNDLILTIQEALRSYYQDKTLAAQNIALEEVNEKLEQKIILFNKFVPNQFLEIVNVNLEKKAEEMTAGEGYVQLSSNVERELTIMFSDIRSFTAICESYTSTESFEFINAYFSVMGPIITNHQGFIDKFIGDAIMAIFINPDDAVNAAIDMQKALIGFNQDRISKGFQAIEMGISLNTGKIILGTIGDGNRLQTTVIGDSVNLSARAEKLNKEFGTGIIITGNTYHKLANLANYHFRYLDSLRVRGKQELVDFYEVLDAQSEEVRNKKLAINQEYQQAVAQLLKGNTEAAKAGFESCLLKLPEDKPSLRHLNKLKEVV